MLKSYLAGLKKKNGSVLLGVSISETQELHLRRIKLNSHPFSEHVLVRLLSNFNAEKIHTYVNSGDRRLRREEMRAIQSLSLVSRPRLY